MLNDIESVHLTLGFLLSGIINTNDLGLIAIGLREGIATVSLESLNSANFVDRLSETIHAGTVVWEIELLDLLNKMIRHWPVHTLSAVKLALMACHRINYIVSNLQFPCKISKIAQEWHQDQVEPEVDVSPYLWDNASVFREYCTRDCWTDICHNRQI
jgi:hypothetical protein